MQSIGERLEEARKRKGISIREAAEATKIRSDYLHKYESNQFDIKLPEIYVRGFLRTYATYLKLPADKIISDYNALGLNSAAQPRSLNREVYGRMDLSVASAKTEKEQQETNPPIPPAHEPEPSATRNPATFVPRGSSGPQIDRGLLIKLGGLVGATVVVVGLLLWVLFGRDDKPANSVSLPSSSDIVWVKPQAGESILTLVAAERVQVTVRQLSTDTVLYQGTLPRGDQRDIPRRGRLEINCETPENLSFKIDGRDYPMRLTATGPFVKKIDIMPPTR